MKRTRKALTVVLAIVVSFSLGWLTKDLLTKTSEPTVLETIRKPLEKYSIENLSDADIPAGNIEIIENNTFEFEFSPDLSNKRLKKTTGQINIPEGKGKYPIVLLLRGYVDQETYKTGVGTSRAASVFAENGYITIAPDFLGYGNSDPQAIGIMEARFQTYVTTLSLLESLDQIKQWNKKDILIWGHSNGGQIALTILEITKGKYPTTLWAPVSKPFPYSILYYTDESDDKGKYLRREIAKFEKLYDADKYSIENYFDKIQAPLQLHQGTGDDAVPVEWSQEFVNLAKSLDVDINLYLYSGADHNLQPSWNSATARDLTFFETHLK